MISGLATARAGLALPYRGMLVLLVALGLAGVLNSSATAQIGIPGVTGGSTAQEPAPEVDLDKLRPEGVDRLLGGLSDEQIRAILREELVKDARSRVAAEDAAMSKIGQFEARIDEMASNITERAERWAVALSSLDQRLGKVKERLATAKNGIWGMLLAALVVVLAGVASAWAVSWLTTKARTKVANPAIPPSYWGRLVYTVALSILELLPVFAFVGVTQLAAKLVLGSLGPLVDYVWIYHAGVSGGWFLIVISRRIFAADAPAIRIAPLSDSAVTAIHARLRLAVLIGVGGWLLAGLSPALGFGLPLALVTVALAGTLVAVILIWGVIRDRHRIRGSCAGFLSTSDGPPSIGRRLMAEAAPAVLVAYIAFAYVYWVLIWLEQGQQRLWGPAGTIFVLLLVPALDEIGRELARMVSGRSERAKRYTEVLHGAWRVVLVIAVVAVIFRLWGVPLHTLVLGPHAVPWIRVLWNIALTLLVANLVWQLIMATFRDEGHHGEHEGDPEDSATGEASRLGTLIPLLRTVLLGVVIAVTLMMLLSAMGLDIGPLLASAGIIGIAVGFGAQTLVRDIFSGMFFLIDDAFRVGEYIETDNNLRGEVESISIRSLQLRNHKGPVVTVPFGELKSITNHNRDWVIYKMNFRLEPDTDPAKVKKVVKEIGKELLANPVFGQNFIEPLKSQGVYMIDEDSALVIRVKFKCKPRTQFVLRREVYHAIKRAFAENDIHFARRKVEVVAVDEEGHEVPVSKEAAAQAASAIAEKEQQAGGGADTDTR